MESRLDLDLQSDRIMNNGEIQNPRNRNAHRTTSSPKLQRLYLKQPSVDCEVVVNDLGVVRSIISGFAWNWKKSVSKVKSKKSSELKGSGIAMEEPELEAWEQTESDKDWDKKLPTGEASPSK
ncbi:hypothetical protein FH972_002104 [Carpinus fangiana]|uniref:Uncharacterized protein n=1 Tax=Carpinus fangiana TaxID=176857 RepID=A0A5N6QDT8_9ROSI|nr:hypothetical protein FH972_002104 [Carpinus fangiana]